MEFHTKYDFVQTRMNDRHTVLSSFVAQMQWGVTSSIKYFKR